jgi:hypothetical protein
LRTLLAFALDTVLSPGENEKPKPVVTRAAINPIYAGDGANPWIQGFLLPEQS